MNSLFVSQSTYGARSFAADDSRFFGGDRPTVGHGRTGSACSWQGNGGSTIMRRSVSRQRAIGSIARRRCGRHGSAWRCSRMISTPAVAVLRVVARFRWRRCRKRSQTYILTCGNFGQEPQDVWNNRWWDDEGCTSFGMRSNWFNGVCRFTYGKYKPGFQDKWTGGCHDSVESDSNGTLSNKSYSAAKPAALDWQKVSTASCWPTQPYLAQAEHHTFGWEPTTVWPHTDPAVLPMAGTPRTQMDVIDLSLLFCPNFNKSSAWRPQMWQGAGVRWAHERTVFREAKSYTHVAQHACCFASLQQLT